MNLKHVSRGLALCAALFGSTAVLADPMKPTPADTKPAKLGDVDLATMGHVHAVNQMEIAMGQLAQKKSTTAGVKAFGATLVTDHTASDKDLAAFAKKRGAVIPKDQPADDADKQAQKDDMAGMAKLKTLKGADFDAQFLTMMVAGHERELAKLDTAIGKTSDDDLRAMLNGIKPVMQGHATTARDLQKNAPHAAN